MARKLTFQHRSEDEETKEAGLFLDFDEMATKGAMSAGDWNIAKWYGVYKARQPGNHMARVVIPGGVFTSAQAKNIAEISERYGQGVVSVTTRQALQLHWLKVGAIPDMLRELRLMGSTTLHGCGDVTRNVAACPQAETCRYRRFDVRPGAQRTSDVLAAARDLDNLPRKYKVTFSGCGADCAQPHINCCGFSAVSTDAGDGFRVVIGGGMGWRPFVAEPLFGFVPADRAVAVARAVGLLFRDHGDRYNRSKSRLKFVVHRQGIDFCRRVVLENLAAEGVETAGFLVDDVDDRGPDYPARPLTEETPEGLDGRLTVRAIIPKGELSFIHFHRLAELAELYGDQRLYSTNRQNLEFNGVLPDDVSLLEGEIHALGLDTEGSFGLPDIVTCVGTTYCPKAVSATHVLFDRIHALVSRDEYAGIRDAAILNITGCPNACSPYRIADLGYRGARIRGEERGSVEAYEIRLGGTQTRFGEKLGDFKLDDCEAVTKSVLDEFMRIRSAEESLSDCVARVGPDHFAALVPAAQYERCPRPADLSVEDGIGREAKDLRTIGLAVPCQEACPTRTDVPAYIEHIAKGEHDAAYRINQEDNVFPGVLGRICTRVCEDRCRHLWTNVEGPVQICHLKRYAADHVRERQGALPSWYEATGKRVAVVGGGPSGLTAARELSRLGHEVTVLEQGPALGGMLVRGIPDFRLPRDIIAAEVDLILQGGVVAQTGVVVDAARIAELAGDHDAVLLAAGTMLPNALDVEGDLSGAQMGLDFMARYNAGELTEVVGDVLVIGGGFTAVDCARSAQRLAPPGSRITLAYRRTEAFLAADLHEIKAMVEEGVAVRTLLSPKVIETDKEGRRRMVFQWNRVGSAPKGEKPPIEPVPGVEVAVPFDTLVVATGQHRDSGLLPDGVTLGEGYRTTHPRVFTTGDFQGGAADVITAVASGKAAAQDIDTVLEGQQRLTPAVRVQITAQDGETGRVRDHDIQPPAPMPILDLAKRMAPGQEVETGFTQDIADIAATRCYLCNHKFTIDPDLCIHCDWCIQVAPRNCIKRVSKVIAEGDGFPTRYIESELARETTFIHIDNDECIRCGNCLRICPVGAIDMKRLARVTECTGC